MPTTFDLSQSKVQKNLLPLKILNEFILVLGHLSFFLISQIKFLSTELNYSNILENQIESLDRITEWLVLEWASGDHPVQPPCQGRAT